MILWDNKQTKNTNHQVIVVLAKDQSPAQALPCVATLSDLMLSVLVPFQPTHNHHPNPIRIEIQLDEFRLEIQRRDQEILAMAAKMKTLEEQHQVNWKASAQVFRLHSKVISVRTTSGT